MNNNNNKCIGITSKNYTHKRIVLNKIPEAKYKDIRFFNLYFWLNIHIWILKYLKLTNMDSNELYIKLFLKYKMIFPQLIKCDILHFFNVINFSTKVPWVISIETCLPYNNLLLNCIKSKNPDFNLIKTDQHIKKVLKILSSDNCKGLLAYSECTKNIQLEILNIFPEYSEKIKKKLIVLHPPQKILIETIDHKNVSYNHDELLRFIFIGKDFFRKGGNQILNVFKEFIEKKKFSFELILITDLNYEENFSYFTQKDSEETVKFISENSNWIKYYQNLPNVNVLDFIVNSHVALLPTWMDTYGYSVLECQAGGCPVITTDLRALTEINNNELGWIIKFPKNRLNHPIYDNIEEFNYCKKSLEDNLRIILLEIFENKQKIKEKAIKCLKNISINHDANIYSKKLNDIYNGKLL